MKILLLNPPFLNRYSRTSRSPAVTKGGTIYYPLWLAYAAGAIASCLLGLLYNSVLYAQPADSPWPMFHYDAKCSGQSDAAGPAAITLLWSYYSTGNKSLPSIGSDGSIVYGTEDHYLHVLNSNGNMKWSYRRTDTLCYQPILSSNKEILSVDNSGNVFSFNSNGTIKWTYAATLGADNNNPVQGSSGLIYTSTADEDYARLVVLNSNGSLKWTYATQMFGAMLREGTDGKIYACAADPDEINGNIWAINSDATMRWSYGVDPGEEPIYGFILGSDDTVYCDVATGLNVFNSTGTLRWSYNPGRQPAIGSNGILYTGRVAFEAFNSNGVMFWSYFGGGTPNDGAITVDANGCTYWGNNDNNFYAFNSDRTFMWSYGTGGNTSFNYGLSIGTNRIAGFSADGNLYVIGATPIEIEPGPLTAGLNFWFDIRLSQSIAKIFDYYIVANTQFGPYTLYFDGTVKAGIHPLYRNVPGYPAPYERRVICNVVLPFTMGGKQVTFYTAAIEARKVPPVRNLDERRPYRLYVIMMDKKMVMVGP